MKKLYIYLIIYLLSIAHLTFASTTFYQFCDYNKCPYLSQNNQYFIKLDRCQVSGGCVIEYGLIKGENHTISLKGELSAETKIIWHSSTIAEIYSANGQSNWYSIIIDFNTMQHTNWLQDVFAINAQKLILAISEIDEAHTRVQVSPIFNLNKKIFISENFSSTFPSIAVIMPDTHFDQNGNLVLVYYAGPNYQETTKVIPIDYSQLGIEN